MTGRDLFGALARVVGLYFVLSGLSNGANFVAAAIQGGTSLVPQSNYAAAAASQIIGGMIAILGARAIVWAAYGQRTGD